MLNLIGKGMPINNPNLSGKAFVVKAFDDLNKSQSKLKDLKKDNYILVCDSTTPDFVPYLPYFKAIVSELGGILSHTAIICREMGIPAIIGVENVLNNVKSGDFLILRDNTLWKKIKK